MDGLLIRKRSSWKLVIEIIEIMHSTATCVGGILPVKKGSLVQKEPPRLFRSLMIKNSLSHHVHDSLGYFCILKRVCQVLRQRISCCVLLVSFQEFLCQDFYKILFVLWLQNSGRGRRKKSWYRFKANGKINRVKPTCKLSCPTLPKL